MIKLNNIQRVYFLGIGGIGMSALARYFKLHGCAVSGYDKTKTPLTATLEEEGIAIHYTPNPSVILPDTDVVIYTPAVAADNPEWDTIRGLDVTMMKRAEVLGLISNSGTCLAVAGTHGKTTTSAILAHILKFYFKEVNAFVGGILTNYQTNFLYSVTSSNYVVEADEFDRSFLHLHPNAAIINSIDADHLDVYGGHDSMVDGFKKFVGQVDENGYAIVHHEIAKDLQNGKTKFYTFGVDAVADYVAQNVRVVKGVFVFDLVHPEGEILGVSLSLPGKHNIENAIAASAVALRCGVTEKGIFDALADFQGVKRRFEITGTYDDIIYIDDYAHHPTEISRVLEAARQMYPNKKLTVIFQPHLYSRTRDFESDFALALSGFDEVILLDIYPARELPIEGVTSQILLEKINADHKVVLKKEEVLAYLNHKELDVLFTLGAGDIDTLVQPIKEFVTA